MKTYDMIMMGDDPTLICWEDEFKRSIGHFGKCARVCQYSVDLPCGISFIAQFIYATGSRDYVVMMPGQCQVKLEGFPGALSILEARLSEHLRKNNITMNYEFRLY